MDAGQDSPDAPRKPHERRWAQPVSDDLEPFAVDPFSKHVRITVDGILSGREEQSRYGESRRQQPMERGFFLSRGWHTHEAGSAQEARSPRAVRSYWPGHPV